MQGRGLTRVPVLVSKQWFAWSDTYGVDIAEGEDDILILASTVVVDVACHADQQRRQDRGFIADNGTADGAAFVSIVRTDTGT